MRTLVQVSNTSFNFAGQANFPFIRAVGLEVVNPTVSGHDAIPHKSLEKIDRELYDGQYDKGLIVGGTAGATTLSTITHQAYNPGNTSLCVLLEGLK
jgi:hypothetical protein